MTTDPQITAGLDQEDTDTTQLQRVAGMVRAGRDLVLGRPP